MKVTETNSLNATITIGLQKGYSNKLNNKDLMIKTIQEYQNTLIRDKKIYLSASITECLIVLSNQKEPHLKIQFINYPKFPLREDIFIKEINNLAKFLMKKYEQNRTVVAFHSKTVMFEINNDIDYRIKK